MKGSACAEKGEGEKFVNDGDNTYGGKYVTNPSAGCFQGTSAGRNGSRSATS